jgi:hypothetical protein
VDVPLQERVEQVVSAPLHVIGVPGAQTPALEQVSP